MTEWEPTAEQASRVLCAVPTRESDEGSLPHLKSVTAAVRKRPAPFLLAGVIGASLLASAPAISGLDSGHRSPAISYSLEETSSVHLYGHTNLGPTASASVRADRQLRKRCARLTARLVRTPRCPAAAGSAARLRRASESSKPLGSWDSTAETSRPSRYLLPDFAIDAIALPTGKILLISKPTELQTVGGQDYGTAHVWDPETGESRSMPPPAPPTPSTLAPGTPAVGLVNLFCAGHSLLPDGRVVIAGGQLSVGADPVRGLYGLWTFNPFSNGGWGSWTTQPSMRHGRWYPTLTTLADGRVVIMSGLDETGVTNATDTEVEVFTPSTNINGVGTLALRGSHPMDLYPRNHLLPDGRILMGAPGRPAILDPTDWSWTDLPNHADGWYGNWSTGVLRPFAPGANSTELMLLGGSQVGQTSTPAAWKLDTDRPEAGFRAAPHTLKRARSHHNTVLLPDGSMVTVGGGLGIDLDPTGPGLYADPVFSSELFSPTTGAWTEGPPQTQARTYHSVALLLPDGRVLSAGDDRGERRNDSTTWRAEYYSPPYLFNGARPVLASAPTAVPYGSVLPISSPQASEVRKVVLMSLSSVTHGVDTGQRAIELPFSVPGGDRIIATTPTNRNIAVPGYYTMFIVNANGVPSQGKLVRLDPSAPVSNLAPLASVSVSPQSPNVGDVVTLTDTSRDPDGSIVARAWDLDADGTFDDGTGGSATTTFATPGEHVVRLQVTDDRGAVNIAVVSIDVRQPAPIEVKRVGVPSPPAGPVAVSKAKAVTPFNRGRNAAIRFDLTVATQVKILVVQIDGKRKRGTLLLDATHGTNTFKIPRSILKRSIPPGKYRISLKAIGGGTVKLTVNLH